MNGKSEMPNRASWLEIDRTALVNNINALRQLLPTKTQLMAVVKGNAYGHGAVPTAQIAEEAGVKWFAVATVDEGVELRQQGIERPILVLGHTPLAGVEEALRRQLTLTLHDAESLAPMAQLAQSHGVHARLHLKVNTGMNRLGIEPAIVLELLQRAHAHRHNIEIEGIFTHLATADQRDQRFAQQQLARFQAVLSQLECAQLRPALAHAANSAATLQLPAAHLDMVRCGIALYGLHPSVESCRLPANFQPALAWKARIVQLTALQPGDCVGYGCTFQAERPTTVATVPIGYADGFPRSPHHWGSVLIHGAKAPIVGRVCMDQTMVDVTDLVAAGATVKSGDEVVLLGSQRGNTLSAETIGQRTGTINYEVVSRILPRVPRLYR